MPLSRYFGTTGANNSRPKRQPVGEYVLVNNGPFQGIGVMGGKGADALGSDQD